MTAQKPDANADPTREQLMVQWRDARRRREAADLGSVAYRRALEEIARIEVEIARIERAMDPPRA
ncbi:MAG: hypothetical protein WEF51_00785 [Chloroflexota bacterium]